MNHLFPVFLKLESLHTLIVGGGYVGLEKITAVTENAPQARITLVAPEIREEIQQLAAFYPHILLLFRTFEDEDLNGKDLVLVATNDKAENRRIKETAQARHLLCNVADTPELCDFYLSSVVQKGNLKMGISTNGKSPTVAKRIKQVLQESFPEEIDETLENMTKIRKKLSGDFTDKVRQLNEITRSLTDT